MKPTDSLKQSAAAAAAVCVLLCAPSAAGAQEGRRQWTLQSCIDYALAGNVDMRQAKAQAAIAAETTAQSRASLFPSLSGAVSYNYSDYPLADYMGDGSVAGSYQLDARWVLYQGGQRRAAIRQSLLQQEGADADEQATVMDIKVAVVSGYMQVMYAREAVAVSEAQLQVSEQQLERGRQMHTVGSLSRSDLAQLVSQCSQDRYALAVARKALDAYCLTLKQTLELDAAADMDVATYAVDDSMVMRAVGAKADVLEQAAGASPSLRSAGIAVRVQELQVDVARSGRRPTLTMQAGVGTGHSTASDAAVADQLRDGTHTTVGLTLSIPIYSQRENRTAINKAGIGVEQARLQSEQARKQLVSTVENIYLDAVSSQAQYEAAREQLTAATESYTLVVEQFAAGMRNTVELLAEKQTVQQASQDLLQSKYTAAMNLLLLDIYRGLM